MLNLPRKLPLKNYKAAYERIAKIAFLTRRAIGGMSLNFMTYLRAVARELARRRAARK